MAYQVTLIPGDGVGPEVTEAARRVLEATGVRFQWDEVVAGEPALALYGDPLPQQVLDSIRRNRVALKGPLTTPIGYGFRSVNVALRQYFDLYAGLRPCHTFPGVPSPYPPIDMVIVRENTEDLYIGLEFERGSAGVEELKALVARTLGRELKGDWGISLKAISEAGSRRIVRFALDYARAHGRKRVTVVTKANILKFSDGLFLSVAQQVAPLYPDIEFEEMLIDNLCMQLVRHPEHFDVLVLPNLYGDLISELCAGLIGGLGLAPSANIGAEGTAIFEPTHGSAPRHAGQNRINPMAAILSGAMMLRHLGEAAAAQRVEQAVARVLQEGKTLSYDIVGEEKAASTSQVADAIIETMEKRNA